MARLDPELLKAYHASRMIRDPERLCRAPFSNIYFNVKGEAAACWLTFFEAPRYPEKSLREIWFGQYFEDLRRRILDADLSERCKVCERNIRNRLFQNPLAKAYDTSHELGKYPSIMEFELSNFCNLGCIMCNGRLSSTIRKNRDALPPQESPYGEKFVDELEEFIPYLKEARFNGGEPFLQKLCWSAWERIIRINPAVEICVATNGTVWNDKVAEILSRGNFRINLSLDGMTKETYESIRVGSKFEKVIENIHRFGKYCRERGKIFSIMINPMRVNWRELPLFVEFCNHHGYYLHFNTIYRPFDLALWTLPSQELASIRDALLSVRFESSFQGNTEKYRNLVENQMGAWLQEQKEREKQKKDHASLQAGKAGAKSEVIERLRGLISDAETLRSATSKLEALEKKVSANVRAPDVYAILLQSPIDWLRHDLENKSLEEMAETLYYRAEYY